MCVYVLFPSLTSLTSIALGPLGVFDLSSTSSTYIALQNLGGAINLCFVVIYSIWY